jgi:poly(A) polymerase
MAQAGVLARVLPGADMRALAPLVHLEGAAGAPPDAMRRLACLGGDDHQERFRLSNTDARDLARLRDHLGSAAGPEELAYRLGADAARDVVLLNAVMCETGLPEDLETRLKLGGSAEFPVRAKDLMPNYLGAALGAKLRELEDRWIASGFVLSRNDLLGQA